MHDYLGVGTWRRASIKGTLEVQDFTKEKFQLTGVFVGSSKKSLNWKWRWGIRKEGEKLFFLIKWKGVEDRDFVDAKEAKMKIPQTVIEFYEEKLNWFNTDNNDSQDEYEE